MSYEIFWFLPTSGDTRYLGKSDFGRAPTNIYMRQIAETADRLGYDGLLIPTGASCTDPWVAAASLVALTRRIKLLVALRTSITGPTAGARQAAALDEALGGRLLLNVVPGGDATELAADGVFLSHDERYAAADEYLSVFKRLMVGETVDFTGRYIRVKGAKNFHDAVQKPWPPLYFGGSSPVAHELAAKHVDAYLTWGEPLEAVTAKIAHARESAARHGRTLRFGARLHVIVRETEEEAWAEADRLISHVTDEDIARAQTNYAQMDSVGQARMAALHRGGRDRLVVAPNLWAGVGLVRGGAGTALVGSPEQVVARLNEYAALGIDTFVLSGYPHLEEAIRFAELAFPLISGKASVTLRNSNQTGGAFDIRAVNDPVLAAS